MLLPIARELTGFRLSSANKRIAALFTTLLLVAFTGFYLLPYWAAICLDTLAVALGAGYSTRLLGRLIPQERIPKPLLTILLRLGH